MPVWATVTLTLGVAIITAATSYVNQHMALTHARLTQVQTNEDEKQKELRSEGYNEFRAFMIKLAEAIDALIFAVRNWESSPNGRVDALVNDAVEKVRQVRIHAPIMLAYVGGSTEALKASNALTDMLGKATYSLRYHAGHTVAAGELWSVPQVELALRPGADDLQRDLATAVTQAISESRPKYPLKGQGTGSG